MERLKREHNLKLIAAVPTITYKVEMLDGKIKEIYSPMNFPDDSQINKIYEPWVNMQIIIPPDRIGQAVQLLYEHEAEVGRSGTVQPPAVNDKCENVFKGADEKFL